MFVKLRYLLVLFVFLAALPVRGDEVKYSGRKRLVVAADVWCPINCPPEYKEQGLAIDLLREVFEPEGYEVVYKILPWSRAIKEARSGNVSVIPGAEKAEVKGFLFPKEPVFFPQTGVYARVDSHLIYAGLPSLNGKRIGITQDYSYEDEIANYFKENKSYIEAVSGENAFDLNYKKLLLGRIDVMVETTAVMNYNIRKWNHTDLIMQLDQFGGSQGIFMAFSPYPHQNRDLVKIYEEGLVKLKKSGRLAQLYFKYRIESKYIKSGSKP